MMKIAFLLLTFCAFSACQSRHVEEKSTSKPEEIVINPQEVKAQLDLSKILDDSLDVVVLETRDECLISEIDRFEYYKDKIFISDRVGQKILAFTSDGKFLKTIGKQGGAPGEYLSFGDYSFKGDSVVVQDRHKKSFNIYDLHSSAYREVPCGVFHWDMIPFDGTMYLVSNCLELPQGNYNLFKFDLNTAQLQAKKLPFSEKDLKKSAFGLKRHASKCGDEALLIYPLNDTIYTVRKEEVLPSYIIRFTERNLPEVVDADNGNLYRYVRANRLLKGLEYMQNSQKYLLGHYIDGGFKYFIYDKERQTIELGQWLVVGTLGNMVVHNVCTTPDNILYFFVNASVLRSNWKSVRSHCKNESYRSRIDNVVAGLSDDSNPVLFRCRFKNK